MIIREANLSDASSYQLLREKIDGESNTWGADPGERFKTIEETRAVIQDTQDQENSHQNTIVLEFKNNLIYRWREYKMQNK